MADMSIWRYANPAEFMRVSGAVLPWFSGLAVLFTVIGVIWGLFDARGGGTGAKRADHLYPCALGHAGD